MDYKPATGTRVGSLLLSNPGEDPPPKQLKLEEM